MSAPIIEPTPIGLALWPVYCSKCGRFLAEAPETAMVICLKCKQRNFPDPNAGLPVKRKPAQDTLW
ncbi:MAG: hypothetical protein P9L94_10165 [Candidatus Hinthialibacter antarcticus]|nr:hypothetical protein [Candidatus Hinthialibacter antarcticus]